jgi:hypothetical protein
VVRAVWERLGSIAVAMASPEPQGLAGAFSGLAGSPYGYATVAPRPFGLAGSPMAHAAVAPPPLLRFFALRCDSWLFYHTCFTTRLRGVSAGKETQGCRDSSHTAMVGAGKFGSAKLPMATATYPRKPSFSQ